MLGIKLNAGITQSAASSKPASSSSSSSTPTPASTPKPAAPSPKIKWDGPIDMSFRIKSCKIVNSRCIISIAVTNGGSKPVSCQVETSRERTKVFDMEGNIYQESTDGCGNNCFAGTKFAGKDIVCGQAQYEIPKDMTVNLSLAIKDFDESASSIKLLQVSFWFYGINTRGTLEVRNIPVTQ